MSEPISFRARTGHVWFTIVFGAVLLVGVRRLLSIALAHFGDPGAGPDFLPMLVAIYAMAVGASLAFSLRRVEVDDRGLTARWLWWRQQVTWDEIVRVRLPWDRGVIVPSVVLDLARPRRRLLGLCLGLRPRLGIADGLRDFHGLVREIVARAPQATVGEGVRAYLEAPHRVPWLHRLLALLPLLALAGTLGAAIITTVLDGAIGLGLMAPILPLCCLLSALGGRALGREWPGKVPLVIATGVLPVASFPAVAAVLAFPMSTLPLFVLVGCLAWTVATLVLCLPWRPGWLAAAGCYAVALAAALGPTWWYAAGEALPFEETEPFDGGVLWVTWSPDGTRTALLAGEKDAPAVHLIRLGDLSVQRLALEGGPARVGGLRWRDDGELLLIEYSGGGAEEDREPQTLTFWACSTARPSPRRLYRKTGPYVHWGAAAPARWILVGVGPTDDAIEEYELVDLRTGGAGNGEAVGTTVGGRELPRRASP